MQVAATADLESTATHSNVLVVFGGLLLVMLLAALDSTIVATALPTIVGEFGGLAHISWVGLAVLADRDVQRRYIASIVTRAGVDVSTAAAWLLVQIERERGVDVNELGRKGKCDAQKLKAATAELLDKSLIAEGSAANVYQLTEAGCQIYNRLVAARREHLVGLWPEWSPRKREEVAEILRRLARELVPEAEPA